MHAGVGQHRLSTTYIIFSDLLLRQLDRLLGPWLSHVGGLSGCWNTSMEPDKKLSAIYYSPRGYWKELTAIKKLASAAKATEQQAKDWLKNQAIWQIFLPAPRHVPRPKFDVAVPNEVHQADLLFLPHDRVRRKTFRYALTVVDIAIRHKEAEPLTSRSSFRLTLGASSWAPSVSCWRSTLSKFGAVGWTSTGTKASWSASTGHWLNASSDTSKPRRCDSPPVNGPRSGRSGCHLLSQL